MWALWLKAHELPHAKISEIVGVTENTLRAYLRSFNEGGVESLKELSFYRPTSELDEHRETLEAHFRENPPASAAQAIEEIERITGIKRGLTQTRAFMHRLGLDFRKVGAVPSKADPKVQEEFKKKSWSHGSKRRKTARERSTL
jgi:transposase